MAETRQSLRTLEVARGSARRWAGMLLGMILLAGAAGGARAASDLATGPVSGLPIPRFVSLKSDRTNVRAGPNKDQEVRWVYTRAGMPVEVTAEFENWRRIRDWEGAEGWVYHSLLSGRRTGMIVPSKKDDLVPLYQEADPASGVVARLQAGVLTQIKNCNGHWCEIAGKGFSGYIVQERRGGAYPIEKVD